MLPLKVKEYKHRNNLKAVKLVQVAPIENYRNKSMGILSKSLDARLQSLSSVHHLILSQNKDDR